MRKPFRARRILFVVSLSAVNLLGLSSRSALYADGSNEKGGYTVATGLLDRDLEAFFFLDALTGELKVAAVNPRTGKFMLACSRKILDDFKGATREAQNPNFMMVTGLAKIVQAVGGGNYRFAESVIYVTELNSGAVNCYGVKVPTNLRNQNNVEKGEIVGLDKIDLRTPAAPAAR